MIEMSLSDFISPDLQAKLARMRHGRELIVAAADAGIESIKRSWTSAERIKSWRGSDLVDSGDLRNSIKVLWLGRDKVRIGSDLFYGRFHQHGFRTRGTKRRTGKRRKFQQPGDVKIEARPFIPVEHGQVGSAAYRRLARAINNAMVRMMLWR